ARARQPVLQRAAVLLSRFKTVPAGARGWRSRRARGGGPRHRRAWRPEGADLRAVPAARRQGIRRRARPGPRQRLRRGDGRYDRRGGHAWRWAHHPGVADSRDQRRACRARSRAVTRVLVIDDEPSILRALRINLTARNYEVSTASDGASGLAAVSRDRP